MISQDKAEEYLQVAALVCQEIDLLAMVAKDETLTLEELRAQILHVQETKDDIISDPIGRQKRYKAACIVWAAVSQGSVRSEPIG